MDFSFNPRLSINLSDPDFKLAEIVKLLNTPSSMRSQASINVLQMYTESVQLFQQVSEDDKSSIFKDCCQVLRHQFSPSGSFVFQTGEMGEFFYIILEGEVSVSVVNEPKKLLEEVCRLGVGGSFGELALIKNQPRSATIQCVKPTHFATLCKKDYLRILGQISNKHLEELLVFFKTLPTFSGWSNKNLIKLSYYFKSVKYKRSQVVFTEGTSAESVFIVKKGEFELLKHVKIQNPRRKSIGNCGRPMPFLKPESFSVVASFAIAGIGEILGDEDIIHNLSRSITCKCYSATAELLEISKNEFKKRIRSEESLNQLTQRQKAKDLHMKNALNFVSVIKQPKLPNLTARHREKDFLNSIRSQNPWDPAQQAFAKKEKAVIMHKALSAVAICTHLPLSTRSNPGKSFNYII